MSGVRNLHSAVGEWWGPLLPRPASLSLAALHPPHTVQSAGALAHLLLLTGAVVTLLVAAGVLVLGGLTETLGDLPTALRGELGRGWSLEPGASPFCAAAVGALSACLWVFYCDAPEDPLPPPPRSPMLSAPRRVRRLSSGRLARHCAGGARGGRRCAPLPPPGDCLRAVAGAAAAAVPLPAAPVLPRSAAGGEQRRGAPGSSMPPAHACACCCCLRCSAASNTRSAPLHSMLPHHRSSRGSRGGQGTCRASPLTCRTC